MKIALCIPTHASCHGWFVQSLANMMTRTLAQGIEVDGKKVQPQLGTSVLMSSNLSKSRNRFFRDAMGAKADYLLTLDADHVFPDWTLLRLLGLGQPVVGISQPMRGRPTAPTAFQGDGARVYTTPELVADKALEQVRFIGLGICLIDMKVVVKLALQAAKEGRSSVFPLFAQTMTEDPDASHGEDAFFCDRLTAAGIPIHVDHILSWETRHIASLPISMKDALDQREAYEALQAAKAAALESSRRKPGPMTTEPRD
jgi:hypothetical protein